MNLSNNFTLDEAVRSALADRNNIDNTPSDAVIQIMIKAAQQMEKVREVLDNLPITVDSWFRCRFLNKLLGSSDTSAHRTGWAIDFICPKFGSPKEICQAIIESGINFDQLIFEGSWVHISFDPKNRNQVLTAIFKPGKKTQYVLGLI
jgi:hypothetical protein